MVKLQLGHRLQELVRVFTHDKTFAETKTQFCCVAVDAETAKLDVLEEGPLHESIRASMSMPAFFEPVKLNGKTFVPRQGNNSYIFPGVGLGAIASRSRLVTDEMFMTAAHTLADCVNPDDLSQGSLYPALPRIREVSAKIATAVASVAYQSGLADGPPPNDLSGFIEGQMYDPHY